MFLSNLCSIPLGACRTDHKGSPSELAPRLSASAHAFTKLRGGRLAVHVHRTNSDRPNERARDADRRVTELADGQALLAGGTRWR
jgi:hypothetical protein